MAKKLTKNQKIGLTVVSILALAGIGYGIFWVLTKDQREDKKGKNGKDSKKDKAGLGKDEPVNVLASFDPNKPPNGCVATIITTSDGDYNYTWCNNHWWTISKEFPVKGSRDIPNWISLESNIVATDILNRKHPNRA